MTPPIQGDGGRLDELKAAAERVIAQVGADGLPPATRADAVALATFVRDLLGRPEAEGPPEFALNWNGEPRVWFRGWSQSADEAITVAAGFLRAAERVTEAARASQAVHPGRPAGEGT